MNKKLFRELFIIQRRQTNQGFNAEEYVEIGRTRGFYQEVSGGYGVKNQRIDGNTTGVLYTVTYSGLQVDDRIISEKTNRAFLVQRNQSEGISDKLDHAEAPLVELFGVL